MLKENESYRKYRGKLLTYKYGKLLKQGLKILRKKIDNNHTTQSYWIKYIMELFMAWYGLLIVKYLIAFLQIFLLLSGHNKASVYLQAP